MIARTALQKDTSRLSAPLLVQRLANAQSKLDAQRLAPAMLVRAVTSGQERLSGVTRVMASLNPDNVLKRGYARVMGAGGTLTSAAEAGREVRLTLKFRDGELGVVPDGAPPSPPPQARPAPKTPRRDDPANQPKLL